MDATLDEGQTIGSLLEDSSSSPGVSGVVCFCHFFLPLHFSYQLTQITFFCFFMVFELTQSTMLLEKDSNFDISSLFMGNVNLS